MVSDVKLAVTATEMEIRDRAPIVFRGPFEESVPTIAELGYDSVEPHIHDSAEMDRGRLKRLLQENGLGLASIGTGSAYGRDGLFLAAEDEGIRKAAIRRLQDHIDTASEYEDAVVIIGLIRGKASDCSSPAAYETILLDSLADCVSHGERQNVTLVLEMVNRYEADCLNTVAEGLAFLEKLPSPRLQLHLDTFHMNIEEMDIAQAIRSAAGKIGHVHAADSDRWYPGHGHYDFRKTLDTLQEIGYRGAISVECFYFPDSLTSGGNACRYLRKYF